MRIIGRQSAEVTCAVLHGYDTAMHGNVHTKSRQCTVMHGIGTGGTFMIISAQSILMYSSGK